MQKRLWRCDGPDCSNVREQEWEDFVLGGDWTSMIVETGETYLDPVEARTRPVRIRVDFCSEECRDKYAAS